MTDPTKAFKEASRRLVVSWPGEREEIVLAGMKSAARRRGRLRRLTLGGASAATLVVAIALLVHGPSRSSNDPSPTPSTARQGERLPDGSMAIFSANARYVVRRTESPTTLTVELSEGTGHFDVVHAPDRRFEVACGTVTVRVVGTAFVVERTSGRVRVSVERGVVQIMTGERSVLLGAGEEWSQSSGGEDAGPSSSVPLGSAEQSLVAPSRSAPLVDRPKVVPSQDWRSLARKQEFDHAFDALSTLGPSATRDDPEDLMLAADVARLSRHPSEAVRPLRLLITNHSKDPRAPLAAFTLGRVLMDSLGQPREAAEAFARCRTLDPNGTLAEDALGREVECWSRAGDPQRARVRADEYLQRYPNGRRTTSVRRFGGLD
jgi:transmembrane sensor